MAFVTQGVKATWANPGANDPTPDKRQAGGWYFNPATGSVDQWFPDGGGAASTGGASLAGSAAGLPSTNASDYFTQAMSLLQPSIDAQVTPLKEQQDIIPKLFESAKQDIGSQQMAQLGSQRAQAAASGITSSSGVEQSQEANIAQDWAKKLSVLPVQEAQALTTLASQIAQIQGGGVKDAMNYAADLAKMASDQIWKQANYNLDAATLDETKRYHDLSIALRASRGGTATDKKQTTIDALKQDIAQGIQQGQPNLFPRMLALYSGELTPDEIGLIYNSVTTAIPSSSPYYGGYKESPQQLGLEASTLKSTQPKPGGTSTNELYQQLGDDISSNRITSLSDALRKYPALNPDQVTTIWNQRQGGGGAAGSFIDKLKLSLFGQ